MLPSYKRAPAPAGGLARRACGLVLCLVAALIATLAVAPAQAQPTVELVKDIRPFGPSTWGAGPAGFVRSRGKIFFSAEDSGNGRELWATDGTPANTRLVRDIRPGRDSSEPTELTDVQGTLYFRADTGDGIQLWRSDGTDDGTAAVPPLGTPAPSWFPTGLTALSGRLLFFNNLEGYNYELWAVEGPSAGATRILGPFASSQLSVAVVNDWLYVSAESQLWKSDGTGAGTTLVATLDSSIEWLKSSGGTLFLGCDGNDLWRSDGTQAPPALVWDGEPVGIRPPDAPNKPVDVFYFIGYDAAHGHELWRSDGTTAGTSIVMDINPGPTSALDISPDSSQLTRAGSLVYFVADDGVSGREVWRSDGSASGTWQLADIWPGFESSRPYHLTDLNGVLFFSASRGEGRGDLWRSDGTREGTAPLIESEEGEGAPMNPHNLRAIDGTLYFAAESPTHHSELWLSDGTAAGTRMITNIRVDASSNPAELTPFRGALYFTAEDELSGRDLWRSDGTEAGTTRVLDLSSADPGANVGEIAVSGGRLFFTSREVEPDPEYETPRNRLWVSDGTTAGTRTILTFPAGSDISSLSNLTDVSGRLYFVAYAHYGYAFGLWRSDGTEAGTRQIASFRSGDDYINVVNMLNVNGTLFFGFYDNDFGMIVYKSDGTTRGTRRIAFEGQWGYMEPLVNIGDTVYFATSDYERSALWKVDRSATRATRVKDVPWMFRHVARAGNTLYFVANTASQHDELWRSDGTSRGTVPLRSFDGSVEELAALRGRLLFSGIDAGAGRELHISNGTSRGTLLLADIAPGPQSSWPQEITPIYRTSWALLAATDGRTGLELWRTGGSPASTRLVADIVPGSGSSSPSDFVAVGSQVFFVAEDGRTGRELWALRSLR